VCAREGKTKHGGDGHDDTKIVVHRAIMAPATDLRVAHAELDDGGEAVGVGSGARGGLVVRRLRVARVGEGAGRDGALRDGPGLRGTQDIRRVDEGEQAPRVDVDATTPDTGAAT